MNHARHATGCARRALFLVLLCAWISSPAFTYVMMKDGDLLDQTPLVIVGRVVGERYAVSGDNGHSYYRVQVTDTLKGTQSTVLQVRVPGSPPGANPFLRVAGTPHFTDAEQVLLFLGPERHGAHGLQQFALGAFHVVQQGARAFAMRNLGGGTALGPGSTLDPPRLLTPFSRWLKARATGETRPADYFSDPRGAQNLPQPMFTTFADKDTGHQVRWKAFDSGMTVDWMRNGGDAYATQIGQALAAWQNDPGSKILLNLAGTTAATDGLTNFDDINTVLFGDPNEEIAGAFDCTMGGTLGQGGPWFQAGANAPTHSFNGTAYQEIVGGDVVIQDGVACSFDKSGKAPAAEVIAHEVGHALGLEHSCGDTDSGACDNNPVGDNDALMRSSTTGGNRGASLGVDDKNAIAFMYGANPSFNSGISGLWFDPSLDGEGYNLISASSGQVLFYYGHDSSGARMWLISETSNRAFVPGIPLSFSMFKGSGGTFASPAPSSTALAMWGTITVTLDNCTGGTVLLSGDDGAKTSIVKPLAGIVGADCMSAAKAAASGLSGLWFDPSLDGEGYNVIQTSSGVVIFYYGYDIGGGRLWLIGGPLPDPITLAQPISLQMFRARPGAFNNPNPSLDAWGTLDAVFNDCSNGVFTLSGTANKTSNVILLAGIDGVACP